MMEDQFLSVINQDLMEEFDDGKNYITVREIIRVTGSDYNRKVDQSEFDYYLNKLQRANPLRTFQDDWASGLFTEAMFMLRKNQIKCEAMLHYIVDHANVVIKDDHIVEACGEYESVAFKLIKRGANVHNMISDNGYNSLHTAAYAGFKNLVKYLLKCKVDPNAISSFSHNALHCACISGNLEVVNLILQTDVKLYLGPNRCDHTPIGSAICCDNYNAAKLVLKSKLCDNLKFEEVYSMFRDLCRHNNENETNSTDFDLFMLIWEKLIPIFDSSTESNFPERPRKSILSLYLNNVVFKSENWFVALKVMLTSTIASDLLKEFLALQNESIFTVLMVMFDQQDVKEDYRVELIKILLSLDVKPSLNDLAKTLLYFKCGIEFELLSLALPDDCFVNDDSEQNQMEYVANVFCGFRDQLDFKKLDNLEEAFYNRVTQYFTPTSSRSSLEAGDDDTINITNIRSLKELSRNAIRRVVVENLEILSVRHFRNSVNSLEIPVKVKKFLMLQTSLNEF